MTTTFSLLFYMKKQKNYLIGEAPIYLRITVNGKRTEIATGRVCYPEKWNAKIGRAKGSKEEVKHFNTFLTQLQLQVQEAYQWLSQEGELITAEIGRAHV